MIMLPEFAKSFLRSFRKESKEQATTIKNAAADAVIANADTVIKAGVHAAERILEKSVASATANTPYAGLAASVTSSVEKAMEEAGDKAAAAAKKAAEKAKG